MWNLDKARKKAINIEKKIVLKTFGKRSIPNFAQLKYLKHFLNKNEKRLLILFVFLTAISFSGILASLYLNNTKILPAKGGEYIEGIVDYPRFINPLYSQNNDADKDLVELIYSGLMRRTDRGLLANDLAKEYKISDDEKTYTFYLRDDVLWHDGKPFMADDIIFTITTIKDSKYNSPIRDSWSGISVEKIDDYTVRFKLNEVFSSFLSLATLKILPKHIWEKVPVASINLAEANNKPIGTGPYKFKSFIKDKVGVIKSYKLERNDKYYGDEVYLDVIVLKFYPDYISAVNALDNRQIDGLAFAPKEARNLLKLKSRLNFYTVILPQYNSLFFNGDKNAVLKDKSIRLALAMAINRPRIITDVLGDDGELIDSPVLPGFLAIDESGKRVQYDVEGAKKLLVSAGWVLKDGNLVREKDGKSLKISITTLEKNQNVRAVGIIKENWEEIGVDVEINIVATGEISENVISKRDYQALLFGEMLGQDLDLYPYWHSSAIKDPGFNLALYSNRNADVLLEQARRSGEKLEKQKKYEDFSSLLAEDFPSIFLWKPTYVYLLDKKIKGIQINNILTSSDRFIYIIKGYVNTKRAFK